MRRIYPVTLLLLLPPLQTRSGSLPFGIPATELTQILNHAQLALQYERQAQQIYNQVQMIRMMTQNGLHLSEVPLFSSMIMSDIVGIKTLVNLTQGLAYGYAANDANFQATYNVNAENLRATPFYQQYAKWANATMNISLGAARMAGLTQDQIMNEQVMNAKLQLMMSTPVGQQHTLEVANSLSFSMLGQMQKLRALIASDMQSKAGFNGYQISKDQAREADTTNATAYVERDADHTQFGSVPNISR